MVLSAKPGYSATVMILRALFANGPLKGQTIGQFASAVAEAVDGKTFRVLQSLSLLMKFLECARHAFGAGASIG